MQGSIAEGLSLYKKQKAKLKSLQVRHKDVWPCQPDERTHGQLFSCTATQPKTSLL